MQFYVLSPIVLILHYKNKLFGYLAVFGFLLINIIVTAVDVYDYGYNPGVIYGLLNSEQFVNSYTKPYTRMAPYLIGILFGFVYRGYVDAKNAKEKAKEIELGKVDDSNLISSKPRQSKITGIEVKLVAWVHVKIFRLISYAVGLTLMLIALWTPYHFETNGPESWSTAEKILFMCSEHILFAFGLVLCFLPMINGYGGPVLRFLTNKYFAVVAKISFSYYLIHPFFIHFFAYNKYECGYLQDSVLLYSLPTTIILSGLSALVLTLVIESPIMGLEKTLLGRR